MSAVEEVGSNDGVDLSNSILLFGEGAVGVANYNANVYVVTASDCGELGFVQLDRF